MSKGIYERKRNQTLCFRATPEERIQIEARIRVSGLEKGDYYRQSLLNQRIEIVAGKYQSDRLAVELKWLRKQIAEVKVWRRTDGDTDILQDSAGRTDKCN